MAPDDFRVRPAPGVEGATAYAVPRASAPTDLKLDGNEGRGPTEADVAEMRQVLTPELLRRYPSTAALEARLAERLAVTADRVIVTAGGDDALDRICRAMLAPGRTIVFPEPGFEMVARYATLAGGDVVRVPWREPTYPTDRVLEVLDERTAVVVVTHPNNPTGGVATADDLRRLSAAIPEGLLLVDLAYVEFADEDLTALALELPNALVVRTFSKAWGLAGARVGYAAGPAPVIAWLRACGAPYAVAAPSIALAGARLDQGDARMDAFVARVRQERAAIAAAFAETGATPWPSQANFVLAEVGDPLWFRDGMAGLGIAVRAFPGKPALDGCSRIACPGGDEDLDRVVHALRTVRAPEALIFDLDGVLADVSSSYRTAILQTAAEYGVTLTAEDVQEAKAAGDANNDWIVTTRLLAERGVDVPLADVTATFERLYQGTEEEPGLWTTETALVEPGWLAALAERMPVGIVTGRPRGDAERFLEQMGFAPSISALVCMEDGPAKPDPAPVRTGLERLGVQRAWMIGDTPDDIVAARAAGVVPLGIRAPGDAAPAETALIRAGAARVLPDLDALLEVLP